MDERETELGRRARWFCVHMCRNDDKSCPIAEVDHAGIHCPLWQFVNWERVEAAARRQDGAPVAQ